MAGIGSASDKRSPFCDMRAARERTFDWGTGRCGVQTSSADALKTGFGRRDVANDWSGLRADISAAHRADA